MEEKGNKEGVWKIKKGIEGLKRKPLPKALFNDKGDLMTSRKELLGEVRAAVSELINPTEKHWLGERDELFEREIERRQ